MSDVRVYDKIVYRRIEDIIPYENNPRVNTRAVDALEKVIPEFGFNQPIVIDHNNVIIKGHSRYEAMKRMGCEAIPCIVSDNTDELNDENRLLDNKLHELSAWDNEKLNYELREMRVNLRDMKVDVPLVQNGVSQVSDVRAEDIVSAKTEVLVNKSKTKEESQSRDLIECHCENCGQTFFVSRQEVERYV